jgi:hypothetical protein
MWGYLSSLVILYVCLRVTSVRALFSVHRPLVTLSGQLVITSTSPQTIQTTRAELAKRDLPVNVCGWLGGVQCELDQYSNKYQIRFLKQVLMDIYLISFIAVSVSVTCEWRTNNHYLCLELRTTSRRGHGRYLADSVYFVRYLLR